MVVHLFPYSFFVNGFVSFLTDNFDSNQHKVIVYRKKDYAQDPLSSHMIIEYKGRKDIIELYKQLLAADRIVIHSLGIEFEMLVLLYVKKKLVKKCVWVIWGNDLYCKLQKKEDFMSVFIEHMRSKVIKRFPYIGCLVMGDYTLATDWYETSASAIRVNYCVPAQKEMIDALLSERPTSFPSDTIRIIVGNSGTQSNNHLVALEKLRKWKNADIQIYVPLSYGDSEYSVRIREAFIKEFGDKVTILDKIIPLSEYFSLLASMNIAIFENDRQQALGNIFSLMYMGKKIYMKKGTSMWNELVEQCSSCIFDSDDILNESFLSLQLSEQDIKRNREISYKYHYDPDYLSIGWSKAFNS